MITIELVGDHREGCGAIAGQYEPAWVHGGIRWDPSALGGEGGYVVALSCNDPDCRAILTTPLAEIHELMLKGAPEAAVKPSRPRRKRTTTAKSKSTAKSKAAAPA